MTEPQQDPSDHPSTEAAGVPVTGQPAVDHALESLQGLESEPLSEHHDRLAAVHEELHAALNPEHPAQAD